MKSTTTVSSTNVNATRSYARTSSGMSPIGEFLFECATALFSPSQAPTAEPTLSNRLLAALDEVRSIISSEQLLGERKSLAINAIRSALKSHVNDLKQLELFVNVLATPEFKENFLNRHQGIKGYFWLNTGSWNEVMALINRRRDQIARLEALCAEMSM